MICHVCGYESEDINEFLLVPAGGQCMDSLSCSHVQNGQPREPAKS